MEVWKHPPPPIPNTPNPTHPKARLHRSLHETVRALWEAAPGLGVKPLLAKLQEQQPDLGAATKEVRVALMALKAKSEAAKAAAAAPPAAAEGAAPSNAVLSLACIGCLRLPSDMDDEREKHPICDMCRDLKLPTTYLCGVNCPANPGAWQLHGVFHKNLRRQRKRDEDGGEWQQQARETAEEQARIAAQSGEKYDELLAESARYTYKEDFRRAAKACREAIALRPDQPGAYYNLGRALNDSGHNVEAAQRFLEAKERYPVGSEKWARATAAAFDMLAREVCAEVPKPEWWNDEELKVLSARVVRAAPNEVAAYMMRAHVLCGRSCGAWVAGSRSTAELKKAATRYARAAVLHPAPVMKEMLAELAAWCLSQVGAV